MGTGRRGSRRPGLGLLVLAVLGSSVATAAIGGRVAAATGCGTGPGWPLVGADLANSRSAPGGPAATAAPRLQVRWRFHAADGDFTGTPAVTGCRVFVGSNGGWVRALDERTGAVLWRTHLAGPIPSSAAVVGGRVFVAVARAGTPFVAALDELTGRLLWQATIDRQADSDAYGSPLAANGVVFEGVAAVVSQEVGSSSTHVRGGLAALDATSGRLLWHTYMVPPGDDGGAIWSTPALDAATGLLYIGTGNAYHPPAAPMTDSIVELRAATGAVVAHFQATNNDVFGASMPAGSDVDFGAAPNLLVLPGGVRAVGAGQKAGVYWAFRRGSLRPIWQSRIGVGNAFGGIVGSTAYDGQRVYGPNTLPGYLWGIGVSGGAPAWVEPVADPLHYGPVSQSNGVVYSADSLGFLDVFAASTGVPLARFPLNAVPPTAGYAQAYGGVSIADGTVFADTGSQQSAGDVVALR